MRVAFYLRPMKNEQDKLYNLFSLWLARENENKYKNQSILLTNVEMKVEGAIITVFRNEINLNEILFRTSAQVYHAIDDGTVAIPLSGITGNIIHTVSGSKKDENNINLLLPDLNQVNESHLEEFQKTIFHAVTKCHKTFCIVYGKEDDVKNMYYFGGSHNNTQNLVFKFPYVEQRNISNVELSPNNHSLQQPDNSLSISVSCNWCPSVQLRKEWEHMSEYSRWNAGLDLPNVKFSIEDRKADYFVIINKPFPGTVYDPKRAIVARMEPYIEKDEKFNDWYVEKNSFMYFLEHNEFRNTCEWWLKDPSLPSELLSFHPVKTKLLSTVVSSQYKDEGHKLRIDFIKYFQVQNKLEIDVYGYDNKHGFSNYKGRLPEKCKNDGIFPYKYTLAVENNNIPNYFTEKIIDAILGESLCFYWGTETIDEYIDSRAYIRLDLYKPEESLEKMMNAINNNEWEKRIEYIRKAKEDIILRMSFWPRISALIYIKNFAFYHISTSSCQMNFKIPGISSIQFLSSSPQKLQDPKYGINQSLMRNFLNSSASTVELARLLEHLNIWFKNKQTNYPVCILEGIPKPHFVDHLTFSLAGLSKQNKKWDILFLDREQFSKNENLAQMHEEIIIDSNLVFDMKKCNYIIHPRGLDKLCNLVEKLGLLTENISAIIAFGHSKFVPENLRLLSWCISSSVCRN